MAKKFQKLDVELPRQPLSDQRAWMIAGWVFALVIILFTVYTYIDYRNDGGNMQDLNENIYEIR